MIDFYKKTANEKTGKNARLFVRFRYVWGDFVKKATFCVRMRLQKNEEYAILKG